MERKLHIDEAVLGVPMGQVAVIGFHQRGVFDDRLSGIGGADHLHSGGIDAINFEHGIRDQFQLRKRAAFADEGFAFQILGPLDALAGREHDGGRRRRLARPGGSSPGRIS